MQTSELREIVKQAVTELWYGSSFSYLMNAPLFNTQKAHAPNPKAYREIFGDTQAEKVHVLITRTLGNIVPGTSWKDQKLELEANNLDYSAEESTFITMSTFRFQTLAELIEKIYRS